ncbi:MAG TPA: hypothetical protein VFS92_06095, partial [Planctomycetota bacterium]|nr:hypothetical protein [Planctomycetota bacterium]
MKLRGWLAGGVATVLAAGWAGAAPWTSHFAGLQSALDARIADLADDPGAAAAAQRTACSRARTVLFGYSPSVAKDLKFAGKIAKTLERVFDPADPLLLEVSGTLDGLEGEIEVERAVLVVEISLLS